MIDRREALKSLLGSTAIPVVKVGGEVPDTPYHWTETDEEMLLCTKAGRILVSIGEDIGKESDGKLHTWTMRASEVQDAGGNYIVYGRFNSKERAMLIAEVMYA